MTAPTVRYRVLTWLQSDGWYWQVRRYAPWGWGPKPRWRACGVVAVCMAPHPEKRDAVAAGREAITALGLPS